MNKLLLPAAILFAVSSGPALSQELEEIVVTAQKREQSLQDVGISITAYSGSELLDRGIDGIVQLQEMTPNLRASSGGFGNNGPSFALRGVGSLTDESTVSSSPVAVHVNEIAAPYPITTSNLLFDLERVEILRGPQGDLFGLNTTGGTINFITRRPTEEFDASVLAEVGEYDRFKVEGFVSGSFSDTVSARIAVSHNERNEGPQYNSEYNEDWGQFKKSGLRLSLRFTPNDMLMADAEVHLSNTESEPLGVRLIDEYPNLTFLSGNPDPVIMQDYWGIRYNKNPDVDPGHGKPGLDHDGVGGSLKLEFDLGSTLLTSLTGYEKFERSEFLDMDGSVAQDGYRVYVSDLWSFSQEFRLGSNSDSALQWLIGANYAQDDLDQTTIFDEPDNVDFPAVGGQNPQQKREIVAAFGHAEYALNDKWSVLGGLRFTDEKRTQTNIGTFLYEDPLGIFGGYFATSPSFLVPGALLTDHCAIVGDIGDGSCSYDPQPGTAEIGGGDWSGKLGVNYVINDDILAYSWIARGVKSGGFNDVAAANSESYIPSKPEYLNAIEFGIKSTLLDGKMRLNASAFYYDYEDQQVGGSILSTNYGFLGALINAPESVVRGGEIEMQWSPTEWLDIRQNVGYTGAKFEKYTSLNQAGISAYHEACGEYYFAGAAECDWELPDPTEPYYNATEHVATVDRKGDTFGGARWSVSGAVTLRMPVGADYEASATVDYNFSSATNDDQRSLTNGDYRTLNNPAILPPDVPFFMADPQGDGTDEKVIRGGYEQTFVNGRITLSKGDEWNVSIFGRNITDERVYGSGGNFNRATGFIPVEPRSWGVRLRYNF